MEFLGTGARLEYNLNSADAGATEDESSTKAAIVELDVR